MIHKPRPIALTLATLIILLALNHTAQACPYLICNAIEIGDARSLPWGGSGGRDAKTDYNVNNLVSDTLALLGSDTPVIVRMETLRRAAVYGAWAVIDDEIGVEVKDLKFARELFAQLQSRAREAKGRAEALALFDLGYLVETYRQSIRDAERAKITGDLDGYSLIVKASSLLGGDANMEFAAAFVTADPQRGEHKAHLKKAVAGAKEGTLLARNLAQYFNRR